MNKIKNESQDSHEQQTYKGNIKTSQRSFSQNLPVRYWCFFECHFAGAGFRSKINERIVAI